MNRTFGFRRGRSHKHHRSRSLLLDSIGTAAVFALVLLAIYLVGAVALTAVLPAGAP